MAYWLLKSEPETWSWQQQVARRAKGEMWDGVRNYQAAKFLKQMHRGDLAFFYHSGKQRAIVGVVEIVKEHYPDPTDDSGKFVAVTVRAKEGLPQPVTLQQLKGDERFADFLLLRQSRLSVMPVTDKQWKAINKLAAKK